MSGFSGINQFGSLTTQSGQRLHLKILTKTAMEQLLKMNMIRL